MKKRLLFLSAACLAIFSCAEPAQEGFSAAMETEAISEVCDAVTSWQIAHHGEFPRSTGDWTNGAFYKGITEWSKVSGQDTYYPFLINIGEKDNWDLLGRIYHADDVCVGQMYFDLFERDGDANKVAKVYERLDYITANYPQSPLQKDDELGKNERWSWCDALFMAPPVYATAYRLTGEKKYLDFLNFEYGVCTDSLYNKEYKLFYRDNMRINLVEANGTKQFWARGCGWVFGGLPLVIDNLPADEPSRQYYIDLFKDMAQGVLATQDAQGAWHASLLDPDSYPTPENSASGFFCYGFAWGIRNGYLDPAVYEEPMTRAWTSLVSAVSTEGKLGFIQPIGAAPAEVTKESNHVYGVGSFLLAGAELYRLASAK
ncbi:MAG: glycoside hydrolase family 88 protein [Rikenellaceae bacterium]